MKIRVLGSATRDLLDGYRLYKKRADGFGPCFPVSLYSDIESLTIHTGVRNVHSGKYRRMLSRRFPFAVYFRTEEEDIRVCAVLDCRRNPAWIRDRLDR